MTPRSAIAAALGLVMTTATAGVFNTATESSPDRITHPTGYDGGGGPLPIRVCVKTTSLNQAEMQVAVQNTVDTWNDLEPMTPNIFKGAANDVPAGALDFESVLLHEVGHCIGLAHPNLDNQSGVAAPDQEYTASENGFNNVFDLDPGADGKRGSADDLRGDDVNLHWFRKSNNNPASIEPAIVDATTYARDLARLPAGESFAANGARAVVAALGFPDSEAVMQQGTEFDEAQRALLHDDVATVRLGMSGIDMVAGTADDYTIALDYLGVSDSPDCNITIEMKTATGGLAFCTTTNGRTRTRELDHRTLRRANITFDDAFNWYFNPVPNEAADAVEPEPVAVPLIAWPGLALGLLMIGSIAGWRSRYRRGA